MVSLATLCLEEARLWTFGGADAGVTVGKRLFRSPGVTVVPGRPGMEVGGSDVPEPGEVDELA